MSHSEQRIINGGFEDADLGYGWEIVPSEDCDFIIWPIGVHSGGWGCVVVSYVGSPAITQQVSFKDVNTLTFWYDIWGDGLQVFIDDALLGTYDWEYDGWKYVSLDVSSYTGIKTLKFGLAYGLEGGNAVFLDDISAYAEPTYWYETYEPKGHIGAHHKKCVLNRRGM
jgi:hypothetical protein